MKVADHTLFNNWNRLSLALQPVSEAQVAVHIIVRNCFCSLVLLLLEEMRVVLTVQMGFPTLAF
jgi:hypothetical protein